jgi:cell division protein FtsB
VDWGPLGDFVWVQNVIFPLIGLGMGGFVLLGVYRTVNRLIDRRHERLAGGGAKLARDVEELEARISQLEEHAARVQDLEERLDFAERMLAKQGQRPLLGDH